MKQSRVPGAYTRRPVRALYLVPSPATPGLTAAERLALTLRRDATVSGRCACGATMASARIGAGGVTRATLAHEPDCPAADGPLLEHLAARLGDRLCMEAVVLELEGAA